MDQSDLRVLRIGTVRSEERIKEEDKVIYLSSIAAIP